MANELTITTTMNYSNAGVIESMTKQNLQVTVTTNRSTRIVMQAEVAGTNLDLGGVSNLGYILIRNMDSTNFVTITNASDTAQLKLKAGEWSLFRLNTGITPKVIADTGACLIEYLLISD